MKSLLVISFAIFNLFLDRNDCFVFTNHNLIVQDDEYYFLRGFYGK